MYFFLNTTTEQEWGGMRQTDRVNGRAKEREEGRVYMSAYLFKLQEIDGQMNNQSDKILIGRQIEKIQIDISSEREKDSERHSEEVDAGKSAKRQW